MKALLAGQLGREAARGRNRDAVLADLARHLGEKDGAASDAWARSGIIGPWRTGGREKLRPALETARDFWKSSGRRHDADR